MRLFFALWPDAETTERIAHAAAVLTLVCDARFVPRENYHVTLVFVGEVTESGLAELRRIGADQRDRCCTIKFNAFEYWPESEVVVAAASDTPSALLELCTSLRRELAAAQLGKSLDQLLSQPRWSLRPPLRTHLTLARKVTQAPVLQAMTPFSWSARSFSLIRSDTSGARSVYTVVDTWPLLDETAKP